MRAHYIHVIAENEALKMAHRDIEKKIDEVISDMECKVKQLTVSTIKQIYTNTLRQLGETMPEENHDK